MTTGPAPTTRAKPPMPYFGGKQRVAEQIVALFPEHAHYVEPYAGGLAVLLAKMPSKIETVNDIDQHLMTFWRVLRDRPEELIMQATFTPHSRKERAAANDLTGDLSELEIARRVWVQLAQGRTGTRRATGWRFYLDAHGTSASMVGYLAGYVRRMPPAAARLAQVSLECRDAIEVITDYGTTPDNLLYVDPPYLGSTRQNGTYLYEMTDEGKHRELAEALAGCRAQIVLSGYMSDLYRDLYGDWNLAEIQASTQQANKPGRHDRTEVCWMNFTRENLFSEVPA